MYPVDEMRNNFSSKTRMRFLFRNTHIEDLEKIISRMSIILQEKIELKAKKDEKRKAKQQNIANIKKIMEERGISLDDLEENSNQYKKVYKKRKAVQRHLYQYIDKEGNNATWHGAEIGRLPREFQKYLKKTGKLRNECIVG